MDVLVTRLATPKMGMEQSLLFPGIGFGLQRHPSSLQRVAIGRDHPGPSRHDAGAVVDEQVFQGCELAPRSGRPREKRGARVGRAFRPSVVVERNPAEHRELVVSVPRRKGPVPDPRRGGRARIGAPNRHDDAHGLLHALEDARRHLRLMPLRRAVDDPDLVRVPAQLRAHFLKAGSVQKPRHGDEGDDAPAVRRAAFGPWWGAISDPARSRVFDSCPSAIPEDLPRRPPPEIDVEVAQMLGMGADVPVRRRHPLAERSGDLVALRAALDPAAQALRLLLVGRIADDDGDLLLPFDRIGAPAGLAEGQEDLRQVLLLGVRVAERVGHEEPCGGYRVRVVEECSQLREDTELRYREGTELHLEPDEAGDGGLDHRGHRPRTLIGRGRLRDPAQDAEQEGAGPGRRIGDGHLRRGEPLRQGEPLPGAQRLVDQPHHGPNHLGRGVVGARLLAQVVVVDAQEVLVEVQPGFRVALADGEPVHRVEHPREGGERGLQRRLVVGIVGEEAERGADEGVGVAQLAGHLVKATTQDDVARPRHQQAEGDRLRVAVREGFVRRAREQELAPVRREVRERGRAAPQLLRHLFAEQPAEAGGGVGQLPGRPGRLRLPLEEVGEQGHEAVGGGQLGAGGLHVALQLNDLPCEFPVAPEAEAVAVRVDEVREGLELRPLLPVVRVAEAAGVGSLPRRLDLDEADQGVSAGDGVVGPRLDVGERCLADHDYGARAQPRKHGKVRDEGLQRRAQLILGRSARTGVRELRFRFKPESGDGLLKLHARSPRLEWVEQVGIRL